MGCPRRCFRSSRMKRRALTPYQTRWRRYSVRFSNCRWRRAGSYRQIRLAIRARAPAFQRLVTPATFDGIVEAGTPYILVDDHIGLGGTLANLRGFLQPRGGLVLAITTLTESRDARRMSLRPETLNLLRTRHGDRLDELWRTHFGYGVDCLTEVDALQLCRQQSVAAVEGFLAKAAVEARGRGLDPAFEQPSPTIASD